jgi:hypothetical protein
VQDALKLTELFLKDVGAPWTYFASLCKLVNVWRDVAKDVLELWTVVHGVRSAREHALKLIPRCIGGRWASVDMTEDRLIKVARLLPPVLEKVLRRMSHNVGDPGDALAALDELRAAQMAARQQKNWAGGERMCSRSSRTGSFLAW